MVVHEEGDHHAEDYGVEFLEDLDILQREEAVEDHLDDEARLQSLDLEIDAEQEALGFIDAVLYARLADDLEPLDFEELEEPLTALQRDFRFAHHREQVADDSLFVQQGLRRVREQK